MVIERLDAEIKKLEENIEIPFNKPYTTGQEFQFINEAISNGQLSGDGVFTKRCHQWLENSVGSPKAFLTHSGTAALEMAAILADLKPGDEVIMPSFTFVSTASSFVSRGAKPVFVDIRTDTLNLDEEQVEQAINSSTKAIVPVHYAGVGCNMKRILELADTYKLKVIEDAAHALMAKDDHKPLGSFGCMAAFSFHETKNLSSGEGGALLINDPALIDRASMVWEKGTNRKQFLLGQTDKYTWQVLGSSFPASELTAAFLWAQMQQATEITAARVNCWNSYQQALKDLEQAGHVQRPTMPESAAHNGHIYFVLVQSKRIRDDLLDYLRQRQIGAVFHYVPLHSSPAGLRYCRTSTPELPNTDSISSRLVRLPLWVGLSENQVSRIVECITEFFMNRQR